MSLLFLDSFDDRTTGGLYPSKYELAEISNASCYVSTPTSRTGRGVNLTFNAGTMPYLRKVFPAKSTIIVGTFLYVQLTAPASPVKFMRFMDGSSEQCSLQ